jgi:hypothetical protein
VTSKVAIGQSGYPTKTTPEISQFPTESDGHIGTQSGVELDYLISAHFFQVECGNPPGSLGLAIPPETGGEEERAIRRLAAHGLD